MFRPNGQKTVYTYVAQQHISVFHQSYSQATSALSTSSPLAIQLLQEPPHSLLNFIHPLINLILSTKPILPFLSRRKHRRRALAFCRSIQLIMYVSRIGALRVVSTGRRLLLRLGVGEAAVAGDLCGLLLGWEAGRLQRCMGCIGGRGGWSGRLLLLLVV
jgi:hypothetical protein